MRELFAKYDTSKNNSIDKLEFSNFINNILFIFYISGFKFYKLLIKFS